MTRTRIQLPSLPLIALAAVSVALIAFGATRWVVDDASGALPALEVAGDSAAAAPGAMDAAKLYAARKDTVVTIQSTIDGNPVNGAGVVVDTSGTIVTASHVLRDYKAGTQATSVRVRFANGDEVVGTERTVDMYNDLAIISVDPKQVTKLVAAPLGDSDQVLVGAPVGNIGAPLGLDWTFTVGVVSATHRTLPSRINGNWEIPDLLQHDSAINEGNSGGPVFNARGEVIGINQQISSRSESSAGLSLAVSSNIVKRALKDWKANGRVQYADLGLQTRDISPQLASAADLGTTSGAMVQEAVGPAQRAGIGLGGTIDYLGSRVQLGDVVVELAGRPVTSSRDFARLAGLIDADAPVDVTFLRGGKRHTVQVDPLPQRIT